jgi:hypothetical protein
VLALALLASRPATAAAPPDAADPAAEAARRVTEGFLRNAAAYLESVGPEQALAVFTDPVGPFVAGERYVFCYRLDGTVVAHGGNPGLVGRSLGALRDARGRPFAAALIRIALTQREGWLSYDWVNPLSRRTEVKDTFSMRLRDDLICSAGHYRE